MKRRLRVTGWLFVACLLAWPSAARADVTAFFGISTKPENRPTRGFAFGVTFIVVGFELEYANTSEKPLIGAPSLRTGMINGLVQTPTSRAQLYLTAGGGFFQERFGEEGETNFGTNIGGGMKLGLVGPLRLRLDYRIYNLRGKAVYHTPHRFYAGANFSF